MIGIIIKKHQFVLIVKGGFDMFNEYQAESSGIFKPVKQLTPQNVRLLDWAMGLGGESGEVLDLLKHAIFHKDTELDKMELAKELGDVLWYVSAIATTTGIDMADVAALNRAKLSHRFHGGGFNTEMSADRHTREAQLKDTPWYKCLQARILNTGNAPVNVIFIGPDGSGKTTLTKIIAERLDMHYHKCDYRQANKPALAKELLHSQIDVIYDRFYYPDELIYSKVKNVTLDESYYHELLSILKELQKVNTIFVYVSADLEVLVERSKAWADDYVDVTELTDIIKQYQKWISYMNIIGIPVIEVDTSDRALDSKEYEDMVVSICFEISKYKRFYGLSEMAEGVNVEWSE